MTAVLIESTLDTNSFRQSTRSQIVANRSTYTFFEDTGVGFGCKVTNTETGDYSNFITISDDTDVGAYAIWYDPWDVLNRDADPNIVHCVWDNSATPGIHYAQFNLKTFSVSTPVTIATTTDVTNVSTLDITRSEGGRLHCMFWTGTDGGAHYQSRNEGDSWTALSTTFAEAVNDSVVLWPDHLNPNLDRRAIMGLFWDADANAISAKRWNAATDTVTENVFATGQTHPGTDGPIGFSTTMGVDGTIFLAIIEDTSPATGVTYTVQSTTATAATSFIGSTALIGSVALSRDQAGRVWCFYGRDPLNADLQDRRVHYVYSDDDMVTWSTEIEYSTRDSEILWISADPQPRERSMFVAYYEQTNGGAASADLYGEDAPITLMITEGQSEPTVRIATTIDHRIFDQALSIDYTGSVNDVPINAAYFATTQPVPIIDGALVIQEYGGPPFEFATTRLGVLPRDNTTPFRITMNITFPQTGPTNWGWNQQVVIGTLDGSEGKVNDCRIVYRGDRDADAGDIDAIMPDGTIVNLDTPNDGLSHEYIIEWRPFGQPGVTGEEQFTFIYDTVIQHEETNSVDATVTSGEFQTAKPWYVQIGTPQIASDDVTALGTALSPARMIELETFDVDPIVGAGTGGFEQEIWPAWTFGPTLTSPDGAEERERWTLDGHTWAYLPTSQIISAGWRKGRNIAGDTFEVKLHGAAAYDDAPPTPTLILRDGPEAYPNQYRGNVLVHQSNAWVMMTNSGSSGPPDTNDFSAWPWNPATESFGTRVASDLGTVRPHGANDINKFDQLAVTDDSGGAPNDVEIIKFNASDGTINTTALASFNTVSPNVTTGIDDCTWHPGGRFLYISTDGGPPNYRILPWDPIEETFGTEIIPGPGQDHTDVGAREAAWTPDGRYLAVAFTDATSPPIVGVIEFDPDEGELVGQMMFPSDAGNGTNGLSVDWHPTLKYLAVGVEDDPYLTIFPIDFSKVGTTEFFGAPIEPTQEDPPGTGGGQSVKWLPRGDHIFIAGNGMDNSETLYAYEFNILTGAFVGSRIDPAAASGGTLNSIAFDRTGSYLFNAHAHLTNEELEVYDLTLEPSCAFNPDNIFWCDDWLGRILTIDTQMSDGVTSDIERRAIAGVVEDASGSMGSSGPEITLRGRDVISAKLDTNYYRAYADYDASASGSNEASAVNLGYTLGEIIQDLVNVGDVAFGVDIMNEDITASPQGDDLTTTETALWVPPFVPQYVDTGDSRLLQVVTSLADQYGLEVWRSYDPIDWTDYGNFEGPQGSGRYGTLRMGRWNWGGEASCFTVYGVDATTGIENAVTIAVKENRTEAAGQVLVTQDGQGATFALLSGGDVGPGAHPAFVFPPEAYGMQVSIPMAGAFIGLSQFQYHSAKEGLVFQRDLEVNPVDNDLLDVPDDSFNAEDAAVMPNGDFVVGLDGTTLKSWAYDKVNERWGDEADSITIAQAGKNVIFNWTGDHVAITSATSPFILVYPINTSTGVFGSKVADPATLPAGIAWGVAFSHADDFIAVAHTTTPYITVYAWNNGTSTFGAKATDPSVLTGLRVGRWPAWTQSDDAIVLTNEPNIGTSDPPIVGWPWSGGAFGTRYSDPPRWDNTGTTRTLAGGWCEFRPITGQQVLAVQETHARNIVGLTFLLFNSTSGFEQTSSGQFSGRDIMVPFLAPWTTYDGSEPPSQKSSWTSDGSGVVHAYRSSTAQGDVGALVTYHHISGTRVQTAIPKRSPDTFGNRGAHSAVVHPDSDQVFVCVVPTANNISSPVKMDFKLPTSWNGGPGRHKWYRENASRRMAAISMVNYDQFNPSDTIAIEDPLRHVVSAVEEHWVVDSVAYHWRPNGELEVTLNCMTTDVIDAINRNSR